MTASVAESNPSALSGGTFVLIVVTAAITALATFFAQSFADKASVRNESSVAEVRQFIDAGEDYRELAPTFMRNLTQDRDLTADQSQLIKNLDLQNASLQTAMSNLDGHRYDAAKDYQIRLARAGRMLATDIEIAHSEALVQELMNILNEEVCISYYLRDETGLEVSKQTMLDCR